MFFQDLYETEYGIYNHLAHTKVRPLASVAMHESEDPNDGSLLEETIRTYVDRGIGDLYKLNLLEFLELPIDVIEMLMLIADETAAKKSNTVADIEKELNKNQTK